MNTNNFQKDKPKTGKDAQSLVATVISSFFIPSIIFVSVPLQVIETNKAEIGSPENLYVWIYGIFIFSGLILLPLFLLPRKGLLTAAPIWLVALGINIIIWHQFHFYFINTAWKVALSSILEAAILATSFWLLTKIPRRSLYVGAAFLTVFYTFFATYSHIEIVGKLGIIKFLRGNPVHVLDQHSGLRPNAVEQTQSSLVYSVTIGSENVVMEEGDVIKLTSETKRKSLIAKIKYSQDRKLVSNAFIRLNLRVLGGVVGIDFANENRKNLLPLNPWSGPKDIYIYVPPSKMNEEIALYNFLGNNQRTTVELHGIDIFMSKTMDVNGTGKPGNVYYFILDAYQKQFYENAILGSSALKFDGYTFYENFATTSGRSNWSIGSTILGKDFLAGDAVNGGALEHITSLAVENGMLTDLWKSDVKIHLYPFMEGYCFKLADDCQSTQKLYDNHLHGGRKRIILDISFLNSIPNGLRAVLMGSIGMKEYDGMTWNYGFSLSAWLDRIFGSRLYSSQEQKTDLLGANVNTFTYKTFEKFLDDERNRPARGQFVFVHLMLPHGPATRSKDCNYVPPGSPMPAGHESQHSCATKVIEKLNNTLKLLGKYDDSMIVVHSDHGLGPDFASKFDASIEKLPHKDFNRSKDDTIVWSPRFIEAISDGLLLVKLPQASGFKTSTLPVQSFDIAPTVYQHFGITKSDHTGIPIQNLSPDFNRAQTFYASNLPVKSFSRYKKRKGGVWTFEKKINITD